jgi:hypothetical protein
VNDIGIDGAIALSEALLSNSSLTSFNLSSTKVVAFGSFTQYRE